MNESRAARYQRLTRRARAASGASAWLMLALIATTPVGGWLEGASIRAAGGLDGTAAWAVSRATFVALVVLLWQAATWPAVLFLALRVDRQYGRSAHSVEDVLTAQAGEALLVLLAALAAVAAVDLAIAVTGSWWWLTAALLLGCVLAVVLRIAPLFLGLVGRVRPLDRPDLTAGIAELARRARIPVAAIREWVTPDHHPASALIAGVGRHRRVLVSSEIARRWSDDEVLVIVAHELAHHVYGDLWRTLALDVLVLALALGCARAAAGWAGALASMRDPAATGALPLVALVAVSVWLLLAPLRFAQARRQERRADVFALAMTNGADAFSSAVRRLGARHLAEERPSRVTRWLSHRHPTVAERLALADAYRRLRPQR